jgi:hypothetical protein
MHFRPEVFLKVTPLEGVVHFAPLSKEGHRLSSAENPITNPQTKGFCKETGLAS